MSSDSRPKSSLLSLFQLYQTTNSDTRLQHDNLQPVDLSITQGAYVTQESTKNQNATSITASTNNYNCTYPATMVQLVKYAITGLLGLLAAQRKSGSMTSVCNLLIPAA